MVHFRYQPGGPRKKNWSLDHLPFRNEWVLLIDADERITPELEREIRELFKQGPTCRGYYLNRMHLFLGRWLRYGETTQAGIFGCCGAMPADTKNSGPKIFRVPVMSKFTSTFS